MTRLMKLNGSIRTFSKKRMTSIETIYMKMMDTATAAAARIPCAKEPIIMSQEEGVVLKRDLQVIVIGQLLAPFKKTEEGTDQNLHHTEHKAPQLWNQNSAWT